MGVGLGDIVALGGLVMFLRLCAYGIMNDNGGYHHPVELLSAFLCQFGCEEALCVPTKYLKEHWEAMKAFRVREVAKTKVELHVATLLYQYKATGRTTLSTRSALSKQSKQW